MGFVLNAVDARQAARDRSATAHFRGEPGNGIESNSGKIFTVMGKRHFDAVREACECDIQVRMVSRQVVEGLEASG